MGKLSTNLIVAICAFLMGLASAMAFNKFNAEEQAHAAQSIHSDAMGNAGIAQD
ncbi:hypothetical protein ICN18_06985 [Polynucleobacter sp. Ross1-W9]|uniref:hypothetical protein n=1 Tax=Polynucleobacter parvulilacunae TaxID=1855631 RepID=UPI001C0BB440|nr:hypothetical protein [Polynucleobacter parvulilacunae]MBU3557370.1 hypothetical protein [Polynucleobacter parvulilacunae]